MSTVHSIANGTSSEPHLQGWTPEPSGRGTWTLLFSCLSTTFLCTWVVIHPRIDDRFLHRSLHKLALSVKAFIAPEFIAVESAQEWAQANRIVKKCRPYTNEEFKLIHAFYLGMFGVRYKVPSAQILGVQSATSRVRTKVLWPMQYLYLLKNGHISWADCKQWGLCEGTIKDKSNADSAAKLIAVLGVAKFVVDTAIRLYRRLPLAPLESMTLAYIPLFGVSYFFWWLKPKDINLPTVADLPPLNEKQQDEFDQLALTDAFDDEDKPHQSSLAGVWRLTPREFELELLHGGPLLRSKRYCQGAVLSNWDPDLYHSWLWPVAGFFGLSFGALHLLSWNSTFPTFAEAWAWRCAALISMVAVLTFMQFKTIVLIWRDPKSILCIALSVLYLASRFVAVAESFASLRASAPAVYMT